VHDIRDGQATTITKNRKHQAGVTCLYEINQNQILTGSYDKTLKLWDRRKITMELEEFCPDKSIWDINFSNNGSRLNIACVYDGYLFVDLNLD
jgi:WD40 repeat protein